MPSRRRRDQSPGVELFVALEFLHRLGGPFEAVDLIVDLLQRIGIRGPVEFPPVRSATLCRVFSSTSTLAMMICMFPGVVLHRMGALPRTPTPMV